MFQYSLKILLLFEGKNGDIWRRIKAAAKTFSKGRKVMRLGNGLKEVKNIQSAMMEPSRALRLASQSCAVIGALGCACDDIVWASDSGILPEKV